MKDILDLHTHTIVSGHAYNSLYEMVRSAADKGLTLYGCSDHTPAMPGGPDAMYFVNFKVIPREIYGVKVLMGAELNLLKPDGSVDLKEKMLEKLSGGGSANLKISGIQQAAEVYAPNGENIASYSSLGGGWTDIQTKEEHKFFSESTMAYLQAYREARAEMKAEAPAVESAASFDTRI